MNDKNEVWFSLMLIRPPGSGTPEAIIVCLLEALADKDPLVTLYCSEETKQPPPLFSSSLVVDPLTIRHL